MAKAKRFTIRLGAVLGTAALIGLAVMANFYFLKVGADTNVEVYKKDGTNFVFYNFSSTVRNEKTRTVMETNGTIGAMIQSEYVYLPIALGPDNIDDIYGEDGKVDKDKQTAWKGIQAIYAKIASAAKSERNLANEALARRSIEELNRKLSSSKASYTYENVPTKNGNSFVVRDLSKFIKSKADREDLNKESYLGASYSGGDRLVVEGTPPSSTDIKINSLTRDNWLGLQKVFKSIMSSAAARGGKEQGGEAYDDYNHAKEWADTIAEALKNAPKSSGAYEPILNDQGYSESFIIANYKGYGITETDINGDQGIMKVSHFDGMPIRGYFRESAVVIPAVMEPAQEISAKITPLTIQIAEKFIPVYQVITKKPLSESDKEKAEASIAAIQAYSDSISCNTNGKYGQKSDKFFTICLPEKKLTNGAKIVQAAKAIMADNPSGGITFSEEDSEIEFPQALEPENVKILTEADKKNWITMTAAYQYIFDNAANTTIQNLASRAMNTIKTITGKGLTVHLLYQDSSVTRLYAYNSVPACQKLKEEADPNVKVAYEGEPNKICTLSFFPNQDKQYTDPRVDSAFIKIIDEILPKASEEDKPAIERMRASYLLTAPDSKSDDDLSISAPSSLRLTEEFVDAASNSEIREIFNGYANDAGPVLKITPHFSQTTAAKFTGNQQLLRVSIKNHASKTYYSEVRDITNKPQQEVEIIWGKGEDWKTYKDYEAFTVGKNLYEIDLINYKDGEEILRKIEFPFSIIGPNGETSADQMLSSDASNPSGGRVSITAPKAIKPTSKAKITITITPPPAKKAGEEKDFLKFYISDAIDDVSQMKESNLKEYCKFNTNDAGKTEKFYHDDWPNTGTKEGKHFIRVKTFRGKPQNSIPDCTTAFSYGASSYTNQEDVDYENDIEYLVNQGFTEDEATDIVDLSRFLQIPRAYATQDSGNFTETQGLDTASSPESEEEDTPADESANFHGLDSASAKSSQKIFYTGKADKEIAVDANADPNAPENKDPDSPNNPNNPNYKSGSKRIDLPGGSSVSSVADAIKRIIFYFFLGTMNVAFLSILYGGYQYIMAGGNTQTAEKAAKTIRFAIFGLIITLMSYAIVKIVLDGYIKFFYK